MAKKALLIGINNYSGKNKLSYCVNDCNELAKILKRNDDETINFEVKQIPNCPNARRALESIKELFEDKYADTALFYFSGHGYIDANNNGGIVFPDNIESDSIYYGIQMDDIMKIVAKSPIKNKVIILDCCKSGKMASDEDNSALLPDGCTILTSSSADQNSVESEEVSHGIFTDLLIQALDGEAADYLGHITVGGIYAYIDRSLGLWGQRPIFKTNISTFESIRNVTPRVDLPTIKETLKLFEEATDTYPLTPEHEWTEYGKDEQDDEKRKKKQEEARDNNKLCLTFQRLQKLVKIGFAEPTHKQDMYWEALYKDEETGENIGSCRLTKIGKYYWKLYKNGRI
ncbi:MAG: caspase family protein [Bacteroidales bacterium]|nr:caspase family protein [Bacteroidales bacterium]